MQVNVLEAKSSLSQLIRSAQAGEDVLIANRGQPVARLVAVPAGAAAQAGVTARTFLAWLKEHPLPAHQVQTHKAIEAGIAAERAAWD